MTDRVAAQAFVPGHVTVFFRPEWADEPVETGSIGGGITLTKGVEVTVERSAEAEISLNGKEIQMRPVSLVLDSFSVTGRVQIETNLPIGCGFGVSGASALGTALAVNQLTGSNKTENELITIAHCAEVTAETGLGDVVAQARGGIPIRLAAGAPGYGRVDGIPEVRRIEFVSFGEVATVDVLRESARLESAGSEALSRLIEAPTVENMFKIGRDFAATTGLLPSSIEAIVEEVVSGGGQATMAMLGETVIALDKGLTDAGYDPCVCQVRHPSASIQAE